MDTTLVVVVIGSAALSLVVLYYGWYHCIKSNLSSRSIYQRSPGAVSLADSEVPVGANENGLSNEERQSAVDIEMVDIYPQS